jgi:hypothetical protein
MVEYVGVTPKGSGYQAQVAGPSGYLGWRPTKKKAALLVAKAKKKKDLRGAQRKVKEPLTCRPLLESIVSDSYATPDANFLRH